MSYTYEEIVNLIMESRRFGKRYGVEVCKDALEYLDRPEADMRIIHIAGTNGKGSCATYIADILSQAGFRVGKFTSPHLVDFRERITIDGEMISSEAVVDYASKLIDMPLGQDGLSMFDYCLLIAILYFRDHACDYVVLECGLGGIYDSTNAVIPAFKLALITNIGYDHTDILGDSIVKIACNKAGIIENSRGLVLAKMPKQAKSAILDVLARYKARLSSDIECADVEDSQYEYVVSLIDRLGLNGYQRDNAYASLVTVDCLSKLDEAFFTSKLPAGDGKEEYLEQAAIRGLEAFYWKGRLCDISSYIPSKLNPASKPIYLDGAHNPQGVLAFKDYLTCMGYDRYVFIVGMLEDKDYSTMIDTMLDISDSFIPLDIDSDRSLSRDELRLYIEKRGGRALEASDFDQAISLAANRGDNVGVAIYGSLYFVGAVYRFIDTNYGD